MKEFAALWAKTYSNLIDNYNANKNTKDRKKSVVKTTLEFEQYRHCLEAIQLENKINHVGKNNLNVDNLQKNYKEFIKTNKLILKPQQRFSREKK